MFFLTFAQDVKYIQTDGYRAPEAELQNSLAQAGVEVEGDSGCTAAVDLWSLGIILLEMFSGIKLKDTVRSQEWKVSSCRSVTGSMNVILQVCICTSLIKKVYQIVKDQKA